MARHFRPAAQFLRSSATTAALLTGAERQAKLLRAIRRVVPPPLAEHCSHAVLDGGRLTIITEGAAWASRLRFFAPALQSGLSPQCGRITHCRVLVQPPSSPDAPSRSPSANVQLSETTVRHLLESADSALDEGIAAAFRRLAKSGGRRA